MLLTAANLVGKLLHNRLKNYITKVVQNSATVGTWWNLIEPEAKGVSRVTRNVARIGNLWPQECNVHAATKCLWRADMHLPTTSRGLLYLPKKLTRNGCFAACFVTKKGQRAGGARVPKRRWKEEASKNTQYGSSKIANEWVGLLPRKCT